MNTIQDGIEVGPTLDLVVTDFLGWKLLWLDKPRVVQPTGDITDIPQWSTDYDLFSSLLALFNPHQPSVHFWFNPATKLWYACFSQEDEYKRIYGAAIPRLECFGKTIMEAGSRAFIAYMAYKRTDDYQRRETSSPSKSG